MKRAGVILLVVLVCLASLVCGCQARPEVLTDLASLHDRSLIYLGKSGEDHLVIDPEAGRRFIVRASQGAVFASAPPCTEITLAADEKGETKLVTTVLMTVRAPVVAAKNATEAAAVYPEALLDSLTYKRGSEYALQEFRIKSSKVLAVKDGLTSVEFIADLKPASDPFLSFMGMRWGTPGPDGFVRDRRLVVNLYGNDGRYCLATRADLFAEGAPDADWTAPETLYRPALNTNRNQMLETGQEVEDVLYEDDTYSYIAGIRLRRNRPDFFVATIYRLERGSGTREALLDLPQNTYAATPLAIHGRTLYLSTSSAPPYSEVRPGHIATLNLDTGEYKVLLTEEATVIGGAGRELYIAGLANASREAGIHSLDTENGAVKRISDLPGTIDNPAYEGCIVLSVSHGRLHVLAPEPNDGGPGPEYAIYTVDLQSGAIERQP